MDKRERFLQLSRCDSDDGYRACLVEAMESVQSGADLLLRRMYRNGGVPAFNYMTGGYRFTEAYCPDEWESFQWVGFLAGRLWLLFVYTGQGRYAEGARRLCEFLIPVLTERPPRFTAAGADIYYGLCLGYEATQERALRDAAIAAIEQFVHLFDVRAGVFYQVADADRVVIDTGLNLGGLYWAQRFGKSYARIAEAHVRSILRLGLVRPDGSVYQAVDVERRTLRASRPYTLQGYSDETTWARGQAWAMHLFASAYEGTGAKDILEVACRVADWYVSHVPADLVPFYDFEDPGRPSVPRDSCAAAIAVAALIRLAKWLPMRARLYRRIVESTLQELVLNYLSPGGVLLHGSWGRMRGEKARLRLGRFPQEDVMPYGNYWIVECLFRELRPEWPGLSLGA
jgi:unsaturated chondroitin disaccharide hydrolase